MTNKPTPDTIAEIAGKLTKAQREAVARASYREADGVWHAAGWYCAADKRVRWNLARTGVTGDYLRRANRLTPLGLQVKAHLEHKSQ